MVRRPLIALLASAAALCFATPAVAVPPGTFGRLLPHAAPFNTPTDQQIADLAALMKDDGGTATDQPDNSTTFVLGQFVDHDLALDREPNPTMPVNIKTLDNTRNALLDLDPVYGDGPKGTPQLYEADGQHLRVGVGTDRATPDVPREADGTAILGDGRNDENLLIAQLHAGFLRFHNRLIDEGKSFEQAQRLTQQTYQYILLNEFLPRFTGTPPRLSLYKPGNKHDPVLPVEFAVAAFRYGHSQVRPAYRLNTSGPVFDVFPIPGGRPDTLIGGRAVPANARVEWDRFFNRTGRPIDAPFNHGKLIDTQISSPLFNLRIGGQGGAADSGPNVLPFRNMIRGKFYDLPSYETTARALGVTPVDVSARLAARGVAGFENGTPLWFGLLAESEAGGGQRLGPTAAMIVNEVIRTNIERDPNGILTKPVAGAPVLGAPACSPSASSECVKTMGDFLVFAGVTGGTF